MQESNRTFYVSIEDEALLGPAGDACKKWNEWVEREMFIIED